MVISYYERERLLDAACSDLARREAIFELTAFGDTQLTYVCIHVDGSSHRIVIADAR